MVAVSPVPQMVWISWGMPYIPSTICLLSVSSIPISAPSVSYGINYYWLLTFFFEMLTASSFELVIFPWSLHTRTYTHTHVMHPSSQGEDYSMSSPRACDLVTLAEECSLGRLGRVYDVKITEPCVNICQVNCDASCTVDLCNHGCFVLICVVLFQTYVCCCMLL